MDVRDASTFPERSPSRVGITLLVYGLSRVATHDWSDPVTVQILGAGATLLVLFLIIEMRSKQPLMPLNLFANRNRSGAYALRMVAGAGIFAVLFFLTPDRPERARLQPAAGRVRVPAPGRRRGHHGPGHLARHRKDRAAAADHVRRTGDRRRHVLALAHHQPRYLCPGHPRAARAPLGRLRARLLPDHAGRRCGRGSAANQGLRRPC